MRTATDRPRGRWWRRARHDRQPCAPAAGVATRRRTPATRRPTCWGGRAGRGRRACRRRLRCQTRQRRRRLRHRSAACRSAPRLRGAPAPARARAPPRRAGRHHRPKPAPASAHRPPGRPVPAARRPRRASAAPLPRRRRRRGSVRRGLDEDARPARERRTVRGIEVAAGNGLQPDDLLAQCGGQLLPHAWTRPSTRSVFSSPRQAASTKSMTCSKPSGPP